MKADTSLSDLQHRIGAGGLLAVRLEDGDIRLTGIDGDTVSVAASRHGPHGLTIERGDGSVSITTGAGPTPDDLSIEVPSAATVVVESRSGDITAEGLKGDVRITTASGDVTIRDAGGTLAIEAVSGDVEVAAVADLAVDARTVSGDLDVRAGLLRRANLTTTSGDLAIDAAFADAGAFVVETVSGDTTVESRSPVRVEATTLTGDVQGPSAGGRDDRPRGTVVVGSTTGATITFRSTSGDLALRVRDDSTSDVARVPDTAPAPAKEVDPTLDVLRALERGEIDVAEATERLAALESEGDDRA